MLERSVQATFGLILGAWGMIGIFEVLKSEVRNSHMGMVLLAAFLLLLLGFVMFFYNIFAVIDEALKARVDKMEMKYLAFRPTRQALGVTTTSKDRVFYTLAPPR